MMRRNWQKNPLNSTTIKMLILTACKSFNRQWKHTMYHFYHNHLLKGNMNSEYWHDSLESASWRKEIFTTYRGKVIFLFSSIHFENKLLVLNTNFNSFKISETSCFIQVPIKYIRKVWIWITRNVRILQECYLKL